MMIRRVPTLILTLALTAPLTLAADTPPATSLPFLTVAPPAPQDQFYPIRLDRRTPVGARFDITASGTLKQTGVILSDGHEVPIPNAPVADLSIDFAARARTDAVDPRGKPTRITYTLDHCTIRATDGPTGGNERHLGDPGTVIVATLHGKQTDFQTDGHPLDAQALLALRSILSLPVGNGDDAAFGSALPRRPGNTWTADPHLAAQDLAQKGITIDPAHVRAATTFTGLQLDGETLCESIRVDVSASNFQLPRNPAAPPGFRTTRTVMLAEMVGLYPQDLDQPRLAESRTMTLDTYMSRPPTTAAGRPMVVRFRQQRTMTLHRTPIKTPE